MLRTHSDARTFALMDAASDTDSGLLCHCGEPVVFGFDLAHPTHHRGMCGHCDAVRCDVDPGACNQRARDERVEWRVETDQTEDEFGTDEQGAREWLAHCREHPDWMPARLMRRTIITNTSEWETVRP